MRKIVIMAALLLAACSNPETPEILAAKSEIAVLYDPDSAIFRLPPMQNEITERGGVYCGMVNAKNRYGGMTGFKPFAAYLHANEDRVHARKHAIAALDGDDEASTWRFCEIYGYSAELLHDAPEWRPPVPGR